MQVLALGEFKGTMEHLCLAQDEDTRMPHVRAAHAATAESSRGLTTQWVARGMKRPTNLDEPAYVFGGLSANSTGAASRMKMRTVTGPTPLNCCNRRSKSARLSQALKIPRTPPW